MGKFLQTVLLLSSGVAALSASAWNVSTEPSFKSVLIEEYTGTHCPNCPDGHMMAAALMRAHHGEVFSVAIHAGPFAIPSRYEPNYITVEGTVIHDSFPINGYPCGVVNRRDVGNGLVQSRSNWGSSARVITKEQSPVNLYLSAAYNADDRELKVDVEGYFTADMKEPKLTVMLLQNNILGPQSGGMLGVEYPHRHMLRDVLTDRVMGDLIEQNKKGEYFSRSISYILPDAIEEVPVEACDVALLAFVAEGDGEIMKVAECFPDVDAAADSRKVIVPAEPLIAIGNSYALDFVELALDNYTAEPVTSAKLDFTLNGKTHSLTWTGEIAPHATGIARFPLNGVMADCYDSDANKYSMIVTEANGRPLALEMLPISGKFSNIAQYPAEMKLKIRTDMDAADNTYRILDEQGAVVKEFGPYPDEMNADYEETVSLEPGKVYGFEVTDSWGNGVFHPRGSVKFYDAADKLVAQFMEINDYGMRSFFRAIDQSGIEEIAVEEIEVEYFDVAGRRVDAPSAGGVFLRRARLANGETITKKVVR